MIDQIKIDKNTLRKIFKEKRLKLTDSELQLSSTKICENFLHNLFPKIHNSKNIYSLYYPSQNEVDNKLIAQFFLKNNIEFCYPQITAKDKPLKFIKASKNSEFIASSLYPKTLEIKNGTEITPNCIILPLLSFDKNKSRLGMGGGFFDRTIAQFYAQNIKITTIAIAFDFQMLDTILPVDKYDQTIDYIVTENSTIL